MRGSGCCLHASSCSARRCRARSPPSGGDSTFSVHGFATFDPRVRVAGVVLNRVGTESHDRMLREALAATGVPVLGTLFRDDALTWRDRRKTAPLWRRWLLFHGSIAAMAGVNGLVFLAARTVLPPAKVPRTLGKKPAWER